MPNSPLHDLWDSPRREVGLLSEPSRGRIKQQSRQVQILLDRGLRKVQFCVKLIDLGCRGCSSLTEQFFFYRRQWFLKMGLVLSEDRKQSLSSSKKHFLELSGKLGSFGLLAVRWLTTKCWSVRCERRHLAASWCLPYIRALGSFRFFIHYFWTRKWRAVWNGIEEATKKIILETRRGL